MIYYKSYRYTKGKRQKHDFTKINEFYETDYIIPVVVCAVYVNYKNINFSYLNVFIMGNLLAP